MASSVEWEWGLLVGNDQDGELDALVVLMSPERLGGDFDRYLCNLYAQSSPRSYGSTHV